jgi:sugar/nucleoside kinase (ribokinase family)
MNKICGIGACVMDTLYEIQSYPAEDTKMRAISSKLAGGGPVATGLVAARKLGVSASFIGNLCDDNGGAFLKKDFEKYGVSTDSINIISGYRSFTSVIWLSSESATRTCVFDKGDLPSLELSKEQYEELKGSDLLMVDGNELDAAISAAKFMRQNGKKVLYDAGGRYEGVERLLPYADYLIPSKEFALGITGCESVEEAAKKLFDTYSPTVVVITCGKDGGIYYDGEKTLTYPIYPAKVVDSNGAGDVFHGAFAAGLMRGFDAYKCCHFASAVSALKCTKVGARDGVPDFDTTKKYMEENGYEL